jgi:hypothetical protein
VTATIRTADVGERARLQRLGATPVIADLTTADGGMLRATSAAANGPALLAPLAAAGQAARKGR